MWNNSHSIWTEAKVARLTELWAAELPASAIGNDLGVSRNAVIGKVSRLNLPPRDPGVNPIARRLVEQKQELDRTERARRGLAPRPIRPYRPKPKSVITAGKHGLGFIKPKPEWSAPVVRPGTSKTSPDYRNRIGLAPDMTPNERRAFLAEAVRNTAELPV